YALKNLGSHQAFVVHGSDGLDEITITGESRVTELKDGQVKTYTICPEDFGLKRGRPEEIKGGDARQNAEIIVSLLNGEMGSRRDIVLLNAAAAIVVGNKAD